MTLSSVGFGAAMDTQLFVDSAALPAANIVSVTGTQIVYLAPAHGTGDSQGEWNGALGDHDVHL